MRHPLSLIALIMFSTTILNGCGMQPAIFDGPSWSLTDSEPAPKSNKKYGDWQGAGAPKPLMYAPGEAPAEPTR